MWRIKFKDSQNARQGMKNRGVIRSEFTRAEKEKCCWNICRRVKNAQMNLDSWDTYCYEVDHLTCLATHKVTASYKPILQSSTSAVLSNLIFLAKDYDAEQPNSNGPNWLNVFLLCATNGFICNILATAIQYISHCNCKEPQLVESCLYSSQDNLSLYWHM